MSSPKYTESGVKVAGGGCDWRCGNCNAFLTETLGFAQDGQSCGHCGMHNRCDFGGDLLSERLADLAVELKRGSVRHDSILMGEAASVLRGMVRDAQHIEKIDRIVLGGEEPTRDRASFPPEMTTA